MKQDLVAIKTPTLSTRAIIGCLSCFIASMPLWSKFSFTHGFLKPGLLHLLLYLADNLTMMDGTRYLVLPGSGASGTDQVWVREGGGGRGMLLLNLMRRHHR